METIKSSSRLTRYLVISCLAVSPSTVNLYPMLPALLGTMVGLMRIFLHNFVRLRTGLLTVGSPVEHPSNHQCN